MEQRALGSQGLRVSRPGLGCMGMSDLCGPPDDEESAATIHRAFDPGATFLDTADMYAVRRNEELAGQVVRERSEGIVGATKFANVRSAEGSFVRISAKPDYINKASLKPTALNVIDLNHQRRVDPNVSIGGTDGAMSDLVHAGKVRFIGLSEAAPDTIRPAHAVHPITALQIEYSPRSCEPEDELLQTVCELGIGFVPYSPPGPGFETGQITSPADFAGDDARRRHPRFQGDAVQRVPDLVARVRELAHCKKCTPVKLALAWVLHQGADIVPIPATRRRGYLEENVDALGVELTANEMEQIEPALPSGAAVGTRYAAPQVQGLDR